MPAVTVPDSASTEIVSESFYRTMVVISNTHATSNLHINFGAAATTDNAYISPGGNMTIAMDSKCLCGINGISSSGDITAKYSTLGNKP